MVRCRTAVIQKYQGLISVLTINLYISRHKSQDTVRFPQKWILLFQSAIWKNLNTASVHTILNDYSGKNRLLGYYLNMENFNRYRKEEMNSISTNMGKNLVYRNKTTQPFLFYAVSFIDSSILFIAIISQVYLSWKWLYFVLYGQM